MLKTISQVSWQWLFWLTLLSVAALSLLPISGTQLFTWEDKVKHCLAYGVLFYLAASGYRQRIAYWRLALVLVFFGVLMEFGQYLTGYRYIDIWDMAANTAGVLLVWGAILLREKL